VRDMKSAAELQDMTSTESRSTSHECSPSYLLDAVPSLVERKREHAKLASKVSDSSSMLSETVQS